MNFEERLLRALDEAGISQSELGRRVGVNSQTVSNWCNTGNFPRKEKLALFPEALGKPLYWFFLSDEEEAHLKATSESKTVLNEKQAALLEVLISYLKLNKPGSYSWPATASKSSINLWLNFSANGRLSPLQPKTDKEHSKGRILRPFFASSISSTLL